MEYVRGRADQARDSRRTDPPAAHSFRAQRLSALRAGQVVSRRKPAALGVCAVLAQGRRVDLDRSRADCERIRAARCVDRTGRTHSPSISPTRLGVDAEFALPAFEDPTYWMLKESDVAAQCRSVRSQDRRSRNARPDGAHIRAWIVEAIRLCAAGSALERGVERPPLEKRKMEPASRQALSGSGRFAAGFQAAARRAALGAARRVPLYPSARSERTAGAASNA